MPNSIAILGVFVADMSFRAERQPKMGETILGKSFALGPGGKGSNQSVAAARAGGDVHFLSALGQDTFADMALAMWSEAGITPHLRQSPDLSTGAAYIFLEDATGDNAIIISPGAAETIAPSDVEAHADVIRDAAIFVTQLEQPMDAALRALQIARDAGTTTILNPAPAATLPEEMFALCDVMTPNETETEALTGLPVTSVAEAEKAARALRSRGVGAVVITLGGDGALYVDERGATHVPVFDAGPVVETTGAGDAFNGGFAVALAEGRDPVEAVRFGCATASLSVTRPGTAPSMPTRIEIDALLSAN